MVEKVKRKKGKPDLLACFRSLFNALRQAGPAGRPLHPLSPSDDDDRDETQFPCFTANALSSSSSYRCCRPLHCRSGQVAAQHRCLSMTNRRQNYHFPPNGAICRRNDRNSQ